ncbi:MULTISPECIES: polyhydroxyalkanoate depolymerase [unclassified Aureimonas]|uniref:polyhydroxyalkanoate depolymerase n=1 Tax=Aureimonas sp. Leaf427 TaxID=1736375 RepID=UPI0009E8260C|nr:polyhydroxyalkanoate depolymerase [Aureimonas sp. Leaf460]
MLYHFYEWNHAAIAPLRAFADAARMFYESPLNPFAGTEAARTMAAMAEVFERSTRVYGKPQFGLNETVVGGLRVPVVDKVVWKKPFAQLLHFERALPAGHSKDPRFLIVAPMSGHYATLLRGTVEALLPYADVYITDWEDARKVPVAVGRFDLDDYVDYVVEMLHFLGPDTHVIGVCQPAVPVLMAVGAMSAKDDPCVPATMTLMGGPIDTRINPTAVNKLAMDKGINWFRDNVVMAVPFPQPGFMRMVYPGFLQLSGFMSMNLDRHVTAHREFYQHLVKNDGDSAEKHREFYDEYMAVMDLTAEFYLQTVDEVFIKHSLPKGEITHRGERIDLSKVTRTALLTVEGENDDISGLGQTKAAQTLCSSLPDDMRVHYMQPKVGHYGVFNGSRFRAEIAPRIVDFALTHGTTHSAAALPRKAGKLTMPDLEAVRALQVESSSEQVHPSEPAETAASMMEPAAEIAETAVVAQLDAVDAVETAVEASVVPVAEAPAAEAPPVDATVPEPDAVSEALLPLRAAVDEVVAKLGLEPQETAVSTGGPVAHPPFADHAAVPALGVPADDELLAASVAPAPVAPAPKAFGPKGRATTPRRTRSR